MNSVELLQRQLAMVNANLRGLIDQVDRDAWLWRAGPGQNRLGFTLFHVPAIQDWAVQTFIRNEPELRQRSGQASRLAASHRLAVGITLAEADTIAEEVEPEDVIAYSDALTAEISAWLADTGEQGLDAIPDSRAHLSAHDAYSDSLYKDEVEGMWDYPVWRLMSGACTGHARGHLGEVDALLALYRGDSLKPHR